MDEDDLACRAHSTEITEEGLLCASAIMMLITLVYIASENGGVRKNGAVPVPGMDGTCVHTSIDPRFCVCNEGQSAVMMSRFGGNETVLTPLSAPPPLLVSSLESNGGQRLIRNEIYQVSRTILAPFFKFLPFKFLGNKHRRSDILSKDHLSFKPDILYGFTLFLSGLIRL